MPKSNMYQSLHTTVRGPVAACRSRSRSAPGRCTARPQYGIAAHWRYKEGGKQAKGAADLAWLGQMLEWLKDMADPREFMEGLKIDLYGGQVFVFTPKGDVVNLPGGGDAGGLRLRDPYRGRTPHDRRQGQRQARAARLRAAHRRHGRGAHLEGAGRGPVARTGSSSSTTPRARNKIRQWFCARAARGRPGAGTGRPAAGRAQAERAAQAPCDRGGARRRSLRR